jgi:protein-S-isoprenylcysteine O-methyltransferase Ste14
MIKFFIFVAVSAGLAYISRASLKLPRSHGFHRFFAWEVIIALILLNLEHWFRDPFALHQLASWFLLAASLIVGIPGIYVLRARGKPEARRHGDMPLIGIEKTTRLVTTGVYTYIRHPLYSSLFFLTWGAFFKDLTWVGSVMALGATAFLLATAIIEETENLRYFGTPYQEYMQQTKRFIPFLF